MTHTRVAKTKPRQRGGATVQQLIPDSGLALLRMERVTAKCGLSKSKIYQLIRLGKFPEPIQEGRTSRWLSTDIDSWILQKAGHDPGYWVPILASPPKPLE